MFLIIFALNKISSRKYAMLKYIIMLGSAFLLSSTVLAKNYQFNNTAILQGKVLIIKSLHPNPQFHGGKQPAIALNQQVTVEDEDGQIKTKLIQLISSDSAAYSKLFKNNGKNITVTCDSLFRAETGHHTTKVLCDANHIHYR